MCDTRTDFPGPLPGIFTLDSIGYAGGVACPAGVGSEDELSRQTSRKRLGSGGNGQGQTTGSGCPGRRFGLAWFEALGAASATDPFRSRKPPQGALERLNGLDRKS